MGPGETWPHVHRPATARSLEEGEGTKLEVVPAGHRGKPQVGRTAGSWKYGTGLALGGNWEWSYLPMWTCALEVEGEAQVLEENWNGGKWMFHRGGSSMC